MNSFGEIIAAWDFSKCEIDESLTGTRMLNPSIDFGNACDLNCPYCFIESKLSGIKRRKKDELSKSETISVIDNFAEAGAKTINIVGAGEPLLDRYCIEFLEKIYKANMRSMIFTNGTAIARNPSLAGMLFDLNCSVVLKLNSFSSSIQDAVAGKKGYSQDRDTAINILFQAGFNSTSPTRLGVDTIAFKGNFEELFYNSCVL